MKSPRAGAEDHNGEGPDADGAASAEGINRDAGAAAAEAGGSDAGAAASDGRGNGAATTGAGALAGVMACTWRTATKADFAELVRLFEACDGTPEASGGTYASMAQALERVLESQTGSVAATDLTCVQSTDGTLVGVAWARIPTGTRHEYRGLLFGAVHPSHRGRGIGQALLAWAETRARALLAALPDDRRKVLRIEFDGAREDAGSLFEREGFKLHLVELSMARDLSGPIEDVFPRDVAVLSWAPELVPIFYETWRDAFSDRPRRPDWSQEEWATAFGGGTDFLADESWVMVETRSGVNLADVSPEPSEGMAYIMCDMHTDDSGGQGIPAGGIRQVSVRPRWRGRGLGTALITQALLDFKARGLTKATLEVNANNPGARRLYERLGFQVTGQYTVYTKPVRD